MMVEWVDTEEIKHIAMLLKAQLEESDWLALYQAFTVETENGWRIAHPNLSTYTFDVLWSFNQCVVTPLNGTSCALHSLTLLELSHLHLGDVLLWGLAGCYVSLRLPLGHGRHVCLLHLMINLLRYCLFKMNFRKFS